MESEHSPRRRSALDTIDTLKRFNDLAGLAANPMTDTSYIRSRYDMEKRHLQLGDIADDRFFIQVRNGDKFFTGKPLVIYEWDSETQAVNIENRLELSDKERLFLNATKLLQCEVTQDLFYVDESGERCVRYDPLYYLCLESRNKTVPETS